MGDDRLRTFVECVDEVREAWDEFKNALADALLGTPYRRWLFVVWLICGLLIWLFAPAG